VYNRMQFSHAITSLLHLPLHISIKIRRRFENQGRKGR
jgi:hypothetical protein